MFLDFCSYLQSIQQDTLDLPTLTAYVSYAKKHIHPQLSDEAAEELTRGYVEMRRRGNFPGSSKKVYDHQIRFFVKCLIRFMKQSKFTKSDAVFNFLQVITATPRQLESLIRLAEALARMRFSEWVSAFSDLTYVN